MLLNDYFFTSPQKSCKPLNFIHVKILFPQKAVALLLSVTKDTTMPILLQISILLAVLVLSVASLLRSSLIQR